MQNGWKMRREMEAEIGRRALQRARRLEDAPQSVEECRTEEERVAYALRLAEEEEASALLELDGLAAKSDVILFAIREALRNGE